MQNLINISSYKSLKTFYIENLVQLNNATNLKILIYLFTHLNKLIKGDKMPPFILL